MLEARALRKNIHSSPRKMRLVIDLIRGKGVVDALGAEGGDAGGYVVGVGTPEEIMNISVSHTGRFLRDYLAKSHGSNGANGNLKRNGRRVLENES